MPLLPSRPLTRRLRDRLDGGLVVVTGASSGIGRELSLLLGDAGAQVALVARREQELEEVRAELRRRGGEGHVHPGDLAEAEDADRVARKIVAAHGVPEVLVNNAGHSIRRSVLDSTDRIHDFERTMALNYFGALRLTLAFLPGMCERGSGQIVNASTQGMQANPPRFSAYMASKAALDGFARCMAPEVLPYGVRVTDVYLPLVRTPMIEATPAYRSANAIPAEEAAEMLARAIADRPRHVSTRVGALGQHLYAFDPGGSDRTMSMAYRVAAERDEDGPPPAPPLVRRAMALAGRAFGIRV